MITPTEHEKSEWSRLARDAYANDANYLGHRYSGAAALRFGQSIPFAVYDGLQTLYRTWLIEGKRNPIW